MTTTVTDPEVNQDLKPVILVQIEHDPDMTNPTKYDSNWKFVSFNTRHDSFEEPDKYFTPQYDGNTFIGLKGTEIGLRNKLEHGTAFILGYYSHSDGTWSLSGEGTQCSFDSNNNAGLLIWDGKPNDLGADIEARKKVARGFLETYNDWCNGHGFQYCSKFIDAEDAYDEFGEMLELTELEDIGEVFDSCCGFIDSARDNIFEYARPSIADLLKERGLTAQDVRIEISGDSAFAFTADEFVPTDQDM